MNNHREIFEKIFYKLRIYQNLKVFLSGGALPPDFFSRLITSFNPTTGKILAYVLMDEVSDYEKVVKKSETAFLKWRMVPTPVRGQLVRELGEELRKYKKELGALISLEMGKIIAEGEGEVQEMIDACEYATGLSRMIEGKVLPSERPDHTMLEKWHPIGPVGVITAFNFPVAVWAWNAVLTIICGDSIIWKPSSLTPLCAIAVHKICERLEAKYDIEGLFGLVIGQGSTIGEKMINDSRIKLISATGSCEMVEKVRLAQAKLGNKDPILEGGGNNASIVMEDVADDENLKKIMYNAALFGAAGTTGQRCTTMRRLLVHEKMFNRVIETLPKLYKQLTIGDPLDPKTLVGPLVDKKALDDMVGALTESVKQGGRIICGGTRVGESGLFVEPTIVLAHKDMPIVKEETFAPILYVIKISGLEEGIEINNSVKQGLSSSIFTNNMRYIEKFLSACGSDCGIANVNMGTSGAEIGGAFGGNKATGWGREMGSDCWKAYMRRQTIAVNYGKTLPLAQGIKFEIEAQRI